jgi:hypothetical protein
MRTLLLMVMFLTIATVTEAQWAYITPPWNFYYHPKYDGTTARSIPLGDWQQLAAFDSAAKCEKGRVFAREIRHLAPNDRERLLALFASGAEEQARLEARRLLADHEEFWRDLKAVDPNDAALEKSERNAERKVLQWWSASKCVSTGSRRPK